MSAGKLLDTCFTPFSGTCPKAGPKAVQLIAAPLVKEFEDRAFAALYEHRYALGIDELWRCNGYRADGYAKLVTGEVVLLEMKEALTWGSTKSAGFQLLAARKMLEMPEIRRGLLVFERIGKEWGNRKLGGWQQFALEVENVRDCLQMGALQVCADGSLRLSEHCVFPAQMPSP